MSRKIIQPVTTVVISGRSMTGKRSLAYGLGFALNWPAVRVTGDYVRELQIHRGQEHISLTKFGSKSEVGRTVEWNNWQFVDSNQSSRGCILSGQLAAVSADGIPGVLKILLTCSDEVRVRRWSKEFGHTRAQSKKLLKMRDMADRERDECITGQEDVYDPDRFDFVISTDSREVNRTCDAVARLVWISRSRAGLA